jgi:hypothetical protein
MTVVIEEGFLDSGRFLSKWLLVEKAWHSGSDRERGRLTNSRELKAYTPSKSLSWN